MTVDNCKKLYEHYVKIGYKAAAENMAEKYPEFSGSKTTSTSSETNKKTKS